MKGTISSGDSERGRSANEGSGCGATAVWELPQPYLLFLGDATEPAFAKTAFGLRDWIPEKCVGEFEIAGCTVTTGLRRLSPHEAARHGARGLVIGVAAPGGQIAATWLPALLEAMEAGLDLISGMHIRLSSIPELRNAADALDRQLIDVRHTPGRIPIATGRKRSGNRILTVGTDCALGKKYTALALTRDLRSRGCDVDFRATGQTGVLIAGRGIAVDAVVADFIAGAAEVLSPDASSDHWDVIEGQGSLFHPAYAGVSLGLLHGSQPDVIVVCHAPERRTMVGYPDYPLPTIAETVELNLRHARRVNPAVRCAGISLNTSGLSDADAQSVIEVLSAEMGMPVADPIRGGSALAGLVSACLQS